MNVCRNATSPKIFSLFQVADLVGQLNLLYLVHENDVQTQTSGFPDPMKKKKKKKIYYHLAIILQYE